MRKTIYILESNFAGNGYYCGKIAKSLGFQVKFLCIEPSEYDGLGYSLENCADQIYKVNTYDIKELILYFQNEYLDGENIEAVIAFDDFRVVQAAVISSIYCPKTGPDVKGVLNCRYKDRLRRALSNTSYAVQFETIPLDCIKDPGVGYPCVIKPVDESGSIGVRVCHDKNQVLESLDVIKQRLRPNIRGYSIEPRALVEKYIEGQEFSAEMAWCGEKNQWIPLGFTKKYTTDGKYRAELGHIFPCHPGSFLPENTGEQINSILMQVGLSNTVSHVEFKFSPEYGLNIVEINPRLAGGQIAKLMSFSLDMNVNQLTLEAHLGNAVHVSRSLETSLWVVAFLYSSRAGRVTSVRQVQSISGERETNLVSLPKNVSGVTDGDQRLGYVIRQTENLDEAEKFIANIGKYFEILGEWE